MVCMTELGFGLGPKRPCHHLGSDLMQLSYEENSSPHLCVFNRKFKFCLEKVTELPHLTVLI